MTQRPIEYRAWDGKRMWYNVQNAYDYFGVIQSDDHDPYDSSIEFGSFQQVLNSAKSVMQFTGLTDKNGKEIWEGDVLDYRGSAVAIEWRDAGFRPTNDLLVTLATLAQTEGHPFTHGEVIGNVYENPEFIQSLKK